MEFPGRGDGGNTVGVSTCGVEALLLPCSELPRSEGRGETLVGRPNVGVQAPVRGVGGHSRMGVATRVDALLLSCRKSASTKDWRLSVSDSSGRFRNTGESHADDNVPSISGVAKRPLPGTCTAVVSTGSSSSIRRTVVRRTGGGHVGKSWDFSLSVTLRMHA